MRYIILAMTAHLATVGCLASPASAQSPTVEERLRKIEDRLAIEKVIVADYSAALDTHDWAAFALLFTSDGELNLISSRFPTVSFKGTVQIRGFWDALAAKLPPPPPAARPVSLRHVITNARVILNGDTATATSYYVEIGRLADGKLMVAATGFYADDLRRVNSEWRIARRQIYDYDPPLLNNERASASR